MRAVGGVSLGREGEILVFPLQSWANKQRAEFSQYHFRIHLNRGISSEESEDRESTQYPSSVRL